MDNGENPENTSYSFSDLPDLLREKVEAFDDFELIFTPVLGVSGAQNSCVPPPVLTKPVKVIPLPETPLEKIEEESSQLEQSAFGDRRQSILGLTHLDEVSLAFEREEISALFDRQKSQNETQNLSSRILGKVASTAGLETAEGLQISLGLDEMINFLSSSRAQKQIGTENDLNFPRTGDQTGQILSPQLKSVVPVVVLESESEKIAYGSPSAKRKSRESFLGEPETKRAPPTPPTTAGPSKSSQKTEKSLVTFAAPSNFRRDGGVAGVWGAETGSGKTSGRITPENFKSLQLDYFRPPGETPQTSGLPKQVEPSQLPPQNGATQLDFKKKRSAEVDGGSGKQGAQGGSRGSVGSGVQGMQGELRKPRGSGKFRGQRGSRGLSGSPEPSGHPGPRGSGGLVGSVVSKGSSPSSGRKRSAVRKLSAANSSDSKTGGKGWEIYSQSLRGPQKTGTTTTIYTRLALQDGGGPAIRRYRGRSRDGRASFGRPLTERPGSSLLRRKVGRVENRSTVIDPSRETEKENSVPRQHGPTSLKPSRGTTRTISDQSCFSLHESRDPGSQLEDLDSHHGFSCGVSSSSEVKAGPESSVEGLTPPHLSPLGGLAELRPRRVKLSLEQTQILDASLRNKTELACKKRNIKPLHSSFKHSSPKPPQSLGPAFANSSINRLRDFTSSLSNFSQSEHNLKPKDPPALPPGSPIQPTRGARVQDVKFSQSGYLGLDRNVFPSGIRLVEAYGAQKALRHPSRNQPRNSAANTKTPPPNSSLHGQILNMISGNERIFEKALRMKATRS